MPVLSDRMNIIEIRQVGVDSDPVVAVYEQSFTLPPYNETGEEVRAFEAGLPAVRDLPGFFGFTAWDGDRPVGMSFGHISRPGQWWQDTITGLLGQDFVSEWVDGVFAMAELAVIPSHRRRGIGRRLHDLLLEKANAGRAVLATVAEETPAFHIYQSSGWKVVHPGFQYREGGPQYRILSRQIRSEPVDGSDL